MSNSRLTFVVGTALAISTVLSPVALADGPPTDTVGWTDLTPPAGALVFYVSSSSGSDSNPGTQAAPFQSIARGMSGLRNGQPDQVLLKCGDTWTLSDQITLTKAANSASQYMVLGSYGTGPRPKVRTPSHGIFGGNSAGVHAGFAIVGLDLAPIAMTATSDGIVLLSTTGNTWDNVLIEDCYISGYSAGIVAQTLVDGQTFDGMKIRRCVVADNDNNGGGHAQGIFLGGAANWLIEECVLDNNARSKADMFCHNLYIHQLSGPGIFRNNISARACSHGGQQRPGGTTDNNLFLQNPINFYQGTSALPIAATTNYFRYNVALDSRDINSTDRRGFGYVIGGAANTVVENNIAAHQSSGTAAVTAFDFDGINAATIRNNLVYDWTYGGAGWGTAYQWETGSNGAVLFENNQAYQPNHGMCVRHDGRPLDSTFTYRNNKYFSTNPATGYEQFSSSGGVGGDWNWWRARAVETGTTFANPGAFNATIDAYLLSIGRSGSVAEFMTQARLQGKQNWRDQFTANGANTWVRSRFGMGGSTPTPCYANCDGSTAPPILNANDFQCFLSKYAAQDPSANCDGSTLAPTLTANDFQCFLNKVATGCP